MRGNRKISRGLYAITDCENTPADKLLSVTESILKAGVIILQYRDKSGDQSRREYEATELQKLCQRHDCLFVINDDVRLAKSINSDGVHLGSGDCDYETARNALGAEAIIGISCYNRIAPAIDAEAGGADYVAFGSFHPTTSKQNTVAAEPKIIKEAKEKISLPVVAIGGITPANCAPLIEHGVDLLAAISSIYQAEDPYSAALEFNRLIYTT